MQSSRGFTTITATFFKIERHMGSSIHPDEITNILREQLSGYSSEAELEQVGRVLQVGDGVAQVYGLTKVCAG